MKHLVLAKKRAGLLKRKRKPPRIRAPKEIEAAYLVAIRRFLAELAQMVARQVIPQIPRILRAAPPELRAKRDSAEVLRRDDFDDDIDALVESVRVEFLAKVEAEAPAVTRGIAKQVSRAQLADHQKTFETVLGVRPELSEPWLTPVMDNFVRSNVRAIEDLSEAALDAVERRIGDGVRQGLTASDIASSIQDDIEADGGTITAGRAMFIARDQVTTLYGDMTRVRQQELGVDKYIWRTAHDDRVRDSHRERDGVVFTWAPIEPQLEEMGLEVDDIDGSPGIPKNCRCIAEPDLEGLLTSLEGDNAPDGGETADAGE